MKSIFASQVSDMSGQRAANGAFQKLSCHQSWRQQKCGQQDQVPGSPPPGLQPGSSTEPVSMSEKIGKRGQDDRWLAWPARHPRKAAPRRSGAARYSSAGLGLTWGLKGGTVWPVGQLRAICWLIPLTHTEMEQPEDYILVTTFFEIRNNWGARRTAAVPSQKSGVHPVLGHFREEPSLAFLSTHPEHSHGCSLCKDGNPETETFHSVSRPLQRPDRTVLLKNQLDTYNPHVVVVVFFFVMFKSKGNTLSFF